MVSTSIGYGGILKVVRAGSSDASTLTNANAGVGAANTTTLKIDNYDDYTANHQDVDTDYSYAAKTPGSRLNNLTNFVDKFRN